MKLVTAITLPAFVTLAFGSSPSLRPVTSKDLFGQFKGLQGTWEGENNRGMRESLDFELIAGGSVLMETSHIDYHKGTSMVTMYHLDGDKLLLTHYCVAGNQPRLQATSNSNSRDVDFTFVGGTNIPSRDVGHMDQVKFHFIDKDHYTSRWSFYAKGKESWFEEFTYHRVK